MNTNQKIMTLLGEAWNLFLEQSLEIEKSESSDTLDYRIQTANRSDVMFHINALHRIMSTQELMTRDPQFFDGIPQEKPERIYETTATPGLTRDQFHTLRSRNLYEYWVDLVSRDVDFAVFDDQDIPVATPYKWGKMTPEQRDSWVINLVKTS